MLKNQKHVFWQAFIVTVVIFLIGLFMGIILENWRTGKIASLFDQSEVDLMDIRLQTDIYSSDDFNCDFAESEILGFADRIYEEAKLLGRYEKASALTKDILLQHKKYDILRATLLLNSRNIRQKCNSNYYDVVYIYQYNQPSLEIDARQTVFSRLLGELKEKRGGEILLVPMAGDLDISSINLIMNNYGIVKEDLPVIIINGELLIDELTTLEELEVKISEIDDI